MKRQRTADSDNRVIAKSIWANWIHGYP